MIQIKTVTRPKEKSKATITLSPENLFRGKEPSMWNFWRDGVTSSFLNLFITCREQTRLAFVKGWSTGGLSLAMEFGTCAHWVLEQAYGDTAAVEDSLGDGSLEPLVKKWVKEYEVVWNKEHDAATTAQLKEMETCYGLADRVLPVYFRRWSGDFLGKYQFPLGDGIVQPVQWESLEEVFHVPYTYPDGRHVNVHGRRDGIFRSEKGGRWIFDTKCRSVINEDDLMDTLPYDLQQMVYAWATTEQFKECPAGVQMNVIRRPGQRWLTSDTLQSYLDRVTKDVNDPKRYDHYFIRHQMYLLPEDVARFRKTILDPIMAEVRGWWEGTIPHYMNPNSLVSKYGRCQMFNLIVHNDSTGFSKRKHVFNELGAI